MKWLLLFFWHFFNLCFAVFLLPFTLTRFDVWQLLNVWPFIVALFLMAFSFLVGLKIPFWAASYIETWRNEQKNKGDEARGGTRGNARGND